MMNRLLAAAALALVTAAPVAAQSAVPAQPMGQAAPMQRVDAATFRMMAASSDMLEIQSSRLALERSRNEAVRGFAQRMIRDHTRTTNELMRIAPIQGQPAMDPRHAALLTQLQGAQGADFDRAYVQGQVMAHREAVALFESYARSGDNRQLVAFAREQRPHLRRHLRSAQALQRRMAASGGMAATR
jgi:putative membrane protein